MSALSLLVDYHYCNYRTTHPLIIFLNTRVYKFGYGYIIDLEWKVPSGRERPLVMTINHCRFLDLSMPIA